MTIKLKLNLSAASGLGPSSSSSTLVPTPSSSGGTVLKISRKGKEKSVEPPPAPITPAPTPVTGKVKVKKERNESKAVSTPTSVPNGTPKSTPVATSSAKKSASAKSRPSKLPKSAKRTPSRKQKQTSAIPPHVLSATSTPKGPLTPLPTAFEDTAILTTSPDPLSRDSISPVKSEPPDDTPSAGGGYGEDDNPFFQRRSSELPTPIGDGQLDGSTPLHDDSATPLSTGRSAPPPRKLPKKPLKELVMKIITELRRKDEYALFEDPVDLESFPDYLDIIGGRDNMMDISTISTKNDDGEYRTMDDVEADLRLLVESAQKFNPEGSVPHKEAAKILSIGLKFMDRYRPQVRTPTPSPGPDDSREVSVFSGREATLGPDGLRNDVPPHEYIPVEMLAFPPNSGGALAVGWNLTGGKRSHMKKVTRSKEKFFGKWRHGDLDGSRDLAEMEDIAEVWATHVQNSGKAGGNRRVLDWKGLRKEGEWWDWGGVGGSQGLPPLPGTTYPRPPPRRMRTLDAAEWGVYPETDVEVAFIASRTGEPDHTEVLAEHLRPTRPRPKKGEWVPPNNFINIYEPPLGRTDVDWLADLSTGGTLGEAYERSVHSFLDGAIAGAEKRHGPVGDEHGMDLKGWVKEKYHSGVLQSQVDRHLRVERLDKGSKEQQESNARVQLRRMFPTNTPLDLQPLLQKPLDFMHPGTAGKAGVQAALDHVASEQRRLQLIQQARAAAEPVGGKRKRVEEESPPPTKPNGVPNGLTNGVPNGVPNGLANGVANGVAKKIKLENGLVASLPGSGASSPLSAAPDSPPPPSTPALPPPTPAEPPKPKVELAAAQILENNRLELISLVKCYPLSALRKMNRDAAMRLLPSSVWNLMAPPVTGTGAPSA